MSDAWPKASGCRCLTSILDIIGPQRYTIIFLRENFLIIFCQRGGKGDEIYMIYKIYEIYKRYILYSTLFGKRASALG